MLITGYQCIISYQSALAQKLRINNSLHTKLIKETTFSSIFHISWIWVYRSHYNQKRKNHSNINLQKLTWFIFSQ